MRLGNECVAFLKCRTRIEMNSVVSALILASYKHGLLKFRIHITTSIYYTENSIEVNYA